MTDKKLQIRSKTFMNREKSSPRQLSGNSGSFKWRVPVDVSRNVDFYNLDAIIPVGYRINSVRATQFRQ